LVTRLVIGLIAVGLLLLIFFAIHYAELPLGR
jgi:hypothetical protein